MGRPRPWLAALLAVLYPGLGHLYLRAWLRSLLWFALGASAVALALPQDVARESSLSDPGSILEASSAMTAEASTLGLVLIGLVFGISVADAYMIARQSRMARDPSGADEHPCPVCGKPLDEDLDFCHWCTTEFDRMQGE